MAVCALGCASGFSIAGFFSQALELAHQSLQFSKGLSFVSAVARMHRDLRDAPYPWKSLATSTLGLMMISSSSCGPCAHPSASQLAEESIFPWKILTNILFSFSPLISGMYHFQQNFCQEKFLRLELLVRVWKNHLGGSSNQQSGQDNGGTSAGLFQCRNLT